MIGGNRIDPSAVVKQSTIGERSTVDRDSVVISSRIGDCCDIEKRNLIRNAVIGDMTYTGSETNIMWAEVGKYCCISRQVDIGGNEHNIQSASMMPTYRLKNRLGGKLSKHPQEEPVYVGNDVWIGQGVSIVRKSGLTIGDGAVIGSGAVVTKSIPPYAIVVGVPARVIRYRFSEDVIDRLRKIRWWDWPQAEILAHWDDLSADLQEENLAKLEETARRIFGGTE